MYNAIADTATLKYASATFYSYDIHGNADTLVQDFKGSVMDTLQNRFKKIVYKYDLISGKVNEVKYQPNQADAFYHQYIYDEENRIVNVLTSADSSYWENEAAYSYYKHGPVGRVVIGDQRVQGIDYAYTLQGWLKGINSTSMSPSFDMGADGNNGDPVARDAFGLVLNYYGAADYKPITKSKIAFDTSVAGNFKPLYNGNIASMGVNIGSLGNAMLYTYSYDQLNRLTSMQTSAKALNTNSNKWTFGTWNNYKENISYDGNGNILKYKRYGASTVMDSLNYKYYANTNRLNYITDSVPGGNYNVDIDNQSANNYLYDSIGNTVKDVKEGIDSIHWTVYGKVKQVNKVGGVVIKYTYDAIGNRISKDVNGKQEWYVRDAGGNVMSVYSKGDTSVNAGALTQAEIDLYGSSRLGIYKPHINVQNIVRGDSVWLRGLQTWGRYTTFTRGEKYYEVTDHRGNVMAVVSDKKTGTDGNNDGVVNYYVADVVSASDYSSFGAALEGRELNADVMVNGFNGQRRDRDIQKDHHTALFWEYDSRIGRRWNIDPVKKPWQSDYAVFSNSPIWKIDINGDDDFFNADGTFAYRTKTGTSIKIITKNGTKLLSEIAPNNSSNIKALAKVVAYYAPSASIPVGTRVGISPNTPNANTEDEGASLGFTTKEGINISAKGGVNPTLNNYNNLISTLVHEEKHREAGDPDKGDEYKFTDHLAVYEKQLDGKTFKSTDNPYKVQYAAKYASYLLGALEAGELSDDEFNDRVKNVNTKLKAYGVYIKIGFTSGETPPVKVFGKGNNGKTVTNPGFIKPRTKPN